MNDLTQTPRVRITYEDRQGDSAESRELPFVIGVLGDFSAEGQSRPQRRDWKRLPIDKDTFNRVLDTVRPRVKFTIASSLVGGSLDVDLTFRHIDDFAPGQIVERIDSLHELRRTKSPHDRATLWLHLDRILHAPAFQKLESAWRGLWHLVSRTEPDSQVRIELIDVNKVELLRDLQRADEFDRSYLFKKLYVESYGLRGRDPFALFIGDYTFTTTSEDLELLSKLAAVAAVCHAPFIAAAGPGLVGVDSFAAVSEEGLDVFGRRNFVPFSNSVWERFLQSADSFYVGLTIPRILVRSPYGNGASIDDYHEKTDGAGDLLWGNSAFALGACIANTFERYGWFRNILGAETGLAEGLPTHRIPWALRPGYEIETSMEVVVGERAEMGLPTLGFIPILTNRGTGQALVFSVPSCHKHYHYGLSAIEAKAADSDSPVWRQLPHLLAASRFIHYLKVIGRDFVSLPSRKQLEHILNTWISQYVLVADDPSPAIKAQCPLSSATISLTERPERPGVYLATAYLCPHFQMDEPESNGVFHTEIVWMEAKGVI